MSEKQNYHKVRLYIGNKRRKFLYPKCGVWSICENQCYIPEKFKMIVQQIITHNNPHYYYYPYLDVRSFDLFINLMLTPLNMKIFNPHQLTEKDLEPIFQTFANKQGNEYEIAVKLLQDRLHE